MRRIDSWSGPAWLAIGLAAAHVAAASTFEISPIRAALTANHRIDALTLTNIDATPVVVELHAMRWSQANGEDALVDAHGLLATPPVMQIPAHGAQIVRVALRRDADPNRELSYRLIFQEVPRAAPQDFNGLRIALRLSVPVFVAPRTGRAVGVLTWAGEWLPDGRLRVSATNTGNGHVEVTDFALRIGASPMPLLGIASKYVLPGSTISWTLTAPAGVDRHGPIAIQGHSDQGDFSGDVAVRAS